MLQTIQKWLGTVADVLPPAVSFIFLQHSNDLVIDGAIVHEAQPPDRYGCQ
jgi:hypothetical protein